MIHCIHRNLIHHQTFSPHNTQPTTYKNWHFMRKAMAGTSRDW